MKFRVFIATFAIFALGYATAAVMPAPTLLSRLGLDGLARMAARQVPLHEAQDRYVGQEYGARCATPSGTCVLPYPQPTGTPCTCGSERGTTVR
jgi:hypothetical protein